MKADYKGHNSLAEMISTHIHVWRSALESLKDEAIPGAFLETDDSAYYEHELKALAEIEAAVNAELGGE